MLEKDITIGLKDGLVARETALFVQLTNSFDSNIYVIYNDKKINAKSIMGMMSLGLAKGEKVTVTAEGAEEEKAVEKIAEFLGA